MSSAGWKDVGIDLNVILSKLKNNLFVESPIVALEEISANIRSKRSSGGKNLSGRICSSENKSIVAIVASALEG